MKTSITKSIFTSFLKVSSWFDRHFWVYTGSQNEASWISLGSKCFPLHIFNPTTACLHVMSDQTKIWKNLIIVMSCKSCVSRKWRPIDDSAVCGKLYKPCRSASKMTAHLFKSIQVVGPHSAVSWEVLTSMNLPSCQISLCSGLRSLDFRRTKLSRPWTTSRTSLSFQGRQECSISIILQLSSRVLSPSGRSDLHHWPTDQRVRQCRCRFRITASFAVATMALDFRTIFSHNAKHTSSEIALAKSGVLYWAHKSRAPQMPVL